MGRLIIESRYLRTSDSDLPCVVGKQREVDLFHLVTVIETLCLVKFFFQSQLAVVGGQKASVMVMAKIPFVSYQLLMYSLVMCLCHMKFSELCNETSMNNA